MRKFFKWLGTDLKDIGITFKDGDWKTRLSYLILGFGQFMRKQYARGIAFFALEVAFFYYLFSFGAGYLAKFSTLGTQSKGFNPDGTVRYGDNSFLILLYGLLTIIVIVFFILLWRINIRQNREEELLLAQGKAINTNKQDLHSLLDKNFDKTLLALPVTGIFVFTVLPIIFMICIAFTNYDMDHQPPTYLFTWVGLDNFKTLFTSTTTITFGYVFVRVLIWTLIWACVATSTSFFGGIFLAKFINNKMTRCKKMWRSIFVVTIAIPQFVTLLLVGKLFGDYGIVNSFCNQIGLTAFLQEVGLVGKGLSYIPFLSKPGWAHVNIWVGVPYQMLSATGILMNIPEDQLESAKIDGANDFQIFWKITMPYILFITGPSLITAFISNINNFNVIYLLTSDYVTTNMGFANSNAKEVDLLVTWLFTLTNEYSNYKMASVIGICVFILCAIFTLLSFTRMIAGKKEEELQ